MIKHLRKNALKSIIKGFKSKHIVDWVLELSHMEQILIAHLCEHNSLGHDSALYGQKIKIDLPKNHAGLKAFHEHLTKHGKIRTAHAMMRGGSVGSAIVSGAKTFGKAVGNVLKKVPGVVEDAWNLLKKGAKTGIEFYGKHEGTIKTVAGVAGQVGMALAPSLSFLSPEHQKMMLDASKGMTDYSKEKKKGTDKKKEGGGSWGMYDLPNVHLNL